MAACHARTREGKRCRRRPGAGARYCYAHSAGDVGRPHGLTPDVHERIVAAVRDGAHREQAALAVGVSRSTIQRWLLRGETDGGGEAFQKFAEAVREAEAAAEVNAIGVIRRAAADDWRAAGWYLERAHPDRWGRRTAHERSGPHGAPLAIQSDQPLDLAKLTDDELELLDQLMQRASS